MIAILGMLGSLLPGVANLALISIPLNEAKVAFDRMFEFTSIEPEKETAQIEIEKFEGLFVQNLLFRFPGRTQLLEGVSFQVQRGEIIAIMGENVVEKVLYHKLFNSTILQKVEALQLMVLII